MSRVKFKGQFKSLIPQDWIFQKLYSNNYRSYRKEIDKYTIWIWQLGRELEIDDWSVYSAFILEIILNGKYKEWEVTKGEYKIKYEGIIFSFNQKVVDFLMQMKLDDLIEIVE